MLFTDRSHQSTKVVWVHRGLRGSFHVNWSISSLSNSWLSLRHLSELQWRHITSVFVHVLTVVIVHSETTIWLSNWLITAVWIVVASRRAVYSSIEIFTISSNTDVIYFFSYLHLLTVLVLAEVSSKGSVCVVLRAYSLERRWFRSL